MAAIAPSTTHTVQLKADLYNDVRGFLSESGPAESGAVDRFVEVAVNNYLLRELSKRVQEDMAPHVARMSEEELMAEVDAILEEVLSQR